MALDSLTGCSLSALLADNAQAIAALKANLEDFCGHLDPLEDDHMLLRFLLQERGNVDAAADRVREGREHREKYKEILEKAKKGEHLPQESKIRQFLCYGRWTYPNIESEEECPPMIITRSGKSNPKSLMEHCTVNELVEYFLWERQRCFDDVNKRARDRGKLVMLVGINDLDNASLITGREPLFFEAVKLSSEAGACLFPLLTRKHVMVNSGVVINTLFRLVSSFMPQRVLDKVAFMTCEEFIVASGIPPQSLPDFLGGSCRVPAGSPLGLGSTQQ